MNTQLTRTMKQTWATLFPGIMAPDDCQWAVWFLLHDSNTVKAGIAQLAAKYNKLNGGMDKDFMLRFASSVMNRISRESSDSRN